MYTNEEIRYKYMKYAKLIDQYEKLPEQLFFRKRRQRLLQHASGDVLEVAVGTGRNLSYYSQGCTITGLDYSPEMLNEAMQKTDARHQPIRLIQGNAESLPFEPNAFDTVVSTLATCTFPNPIQALKEMQRVCKPDGRILLFEHGRSRWPILGRIQDNRAERNADIVGCYWNRLPLKLVQASGIQIQSVKSSYGDFLVEIIGQPGRSV